jgi:NADPH:quinone reductase
MRAVWYEKLGPAEAVLQVGTMPDPQPGPGEVRVRIGFSGVNPSDVKRRAGPPTAAIPFPRVIPNQDGAGIIDAIGAGVDPKRVGERVWLHSTCWGRPFGTGAEWALTPDHRAITLPANVSLAVGASLGVPALTAHRAVFGPGSVTGKTVLVTGGAGAVGLYAIQLAKWAGARVITTVSNDEKAALARQAGADQVVNYRKENVADRVLALTGPVDHIVEVDFAANLATTIKVLKGNGSLSTYASMSDREPKIPFYVLMNKNINVLWVTVYDLTREALDAGTRDVNAWLLAGKAVFPPLHQFGLSDMVKAHLAVEQSTVGKVIVAVGGETAGR